MLNSSNTNISDFFDNDFCQFAAYDTLRSVASYIDGLKISGRKAIWTVINNSNFKRIKVAQLGAEVSKNTNYLHGEGSLQEICKKYGIRDRRILRNWIKVYNVHGNFDSVKHAGGGSYMNQGRDTTKEERLAIVKDCLASGKNYGEMAQKHQVSYQQVRTWTLRFEELGKAGLEDRRGKRKKDQEPRTELEAAQIEIERLKHQLYLTEMERDLLKNWTRSRGGMPLTSETGAFVPSHSGMPRGEELSH